MASVRDMPSPQGQSQNDSIPQGILNVHKPVGPTSHDIVAMIRRWSGIRRVGHAGTLDPMAEGVLLVCLGRATRVAEYLMRSAKRYRAEITFGSSTDTYDAQGTVVSVSPPACIPVSIQSIEQALHHFTGQIEQVPPLYSALKRNGRPLYKLARQGEKVTLAPRKVTVEQITIRSWQRPVLSIEVTCGPGTYIRSLAHDLGSALGCDAHLSALCRTASGQFTVETAVPPEALRDAFREHQVERFLHPLDAALSSFPPVTFDSGEAQKLLHGQALTRSLSSGPAERPGARSQLWRAYDPRERLLALVAFDAEKDQWLPRKVFVDPDG